MTTTQRPADSAGWTRIADLEAEIGRLTDRLRAECAALADALDEVTHEFRGDRWCLDFDTDGRLCDSPPDHPAHRTPGRIRAQLEGQA